MKNLHAVDRPSQQASALLRKTRLERIDLDSETTSGSSEKHPLAPIKQFVTHYGWDGDRLVHTETEHAIEHTLYEPDSFVPLLKLTKRKGEPTLSQMMFGASADSSDEARDGNEDTNDSAAIRALLAGLPREQQRMIDDMLNQVAKNPNLARDALARAHAGASAQAQQQQIAALTGHPTSELNDSAQSSALHSANQHLDDLLAQHAKVKNDFPVTVHHIHCDQLGTPIAMIAANGEHAGKVVWSALYDPWGNLLQEHHIDPKNPIAQTIRFQGQHFDSESGLHYNRYRYYDPAIGTYITQDPIGFQGGRHWYAYPTDPNMWFDPKGLQISGYPSMRAYGEAVWNEAGRRIKESAPVQYCKSVIDKFKEGASAEVSGGGMTVFGLGVKQTIGAARDSAGKACVTNATCLVVGPMIGATVDAGVSVGTGTVTPGEKIWQLGAVLGGTAGAGLEGGGMIGSDGSLEVSGGGSLGGGIGGALLVCRKRVSETCN
jgi:RHS repeat-associated protein